MGRVNGLKLFNKPDVTCNSYHQLCIVRVLFSFCVCFVHYRVNDQNVHAATDKEDGKSEV